MKRIIFLIHYVMVGGLALQTGCDGFTDDPGGSNNKKGDTATGSDKEGDTGTEKVDCKDRGRDTDFDMGDCQDIGEGSLTFQGQYQNANIAVTDSDKTYVIHTNWWGLYLPNGPGLDGQRVSYDGLAFTVENPNDAAMSPTSSAPMGYPSIYIGSYSGHASKGSNLPIKVSDIKSVPTSFQTNATEDGLADKNAAYDVWFTATGEPLPSTQYDPGEGGYFLMVWLFKPTNRQPRGYNAHPAQEVEGMDGTWDVWIDDSWSPPCISYVSTEPLDGLNFDLNHFIQDSVENEYGITEDMYLSIIFAGFEIWGGGDCLSLNHFCAQVN
jgi:hypothetical protein